MAAAVDGHCAVCALRLGAEAGNLGGACEYVQVSIYIYTYIYICCIYIYTPIEPGTCKIVGPVKKDGGLKQKPGSKKKH